MRLTDLTISCVVCTTPDPGTTVGLRCDVSTVPGEPPGEARPSFDRLRGGGRRRIRLQTIAQFTGSTCESL